IQNKHFWVGIILFIISVGWYYLIREIKLPGYLKAVWNNEIFGRFFNANDGHRENLRFYIDGLINRRFYFWWILLLSPVTFFSDNKNLKKITFYAVITGLSYLLIISISKTKLAWYDLPLYPAFAVLISGTVYTIISFLSRWRFIKNKFIVDLAFLVILPLLFFQPISKIIDFTFNPKQQSWDQDFYYISYYLRDQVENNKILKNCYVLQPEDLGLSPGIPFHLSHMIFYTNILISRGSNIRFIPKELCKSESQVITNSQPCKKYIDENFESEVVESYKNVEVYNLTRRKN
ncbi:MAG: hypothetical protein JW833_04985, partial [Prolixibacteraceae bacterium]|nr:hypothetical protein [Prolixibacteraceae bacterium]